MSHEISLLEHEFESLLMVSISTMSVKLREAKAQQVPKASQVSTTRRVSFTSVGTQVG